MYVTSGHCDIKYQTMLYCCSCGYVAHANGVAMSCLPDIMQKKIENYGTSWMVAYRCDDSYVDSCVEWDHVQQVVSHKVFVALQENQPNVTRFYDYNRA